MLFCFPFSPSWNVVRMFICHDVEAVHELLHIYNFLLRNLELCCCVVLGVLASLLCLAGILMLNTLTSYLRLF